MLILVVDDHPLYRDALSRLLPRIYADAVVVQANDCEEAFRWLRCSKGCDLVLLDLDIPGMNGHAALTLLRREFPAITVVIVSASEAPGDAMRCIRAGASGFVPKSARTEVLAAALGLVKEGGIYLPPFLMEEVASDGNGGASTGAATPPSGPAKDKLTVRELHVLELLCNGSSNKEIAHRLGIAEPTVRTHLSAVFRALGVANRTQAAREARRKGLVPDP